MHYLLSTIILAITVGSSTGSPVEVSGFSKALSKRQWLYSNQTDDVNSKNHAFGQQYVISDYPKWIITLDGGQTCTAQVVSWQTSDDPDTEVIAPFYHLNDTLTNATAEERTAILLATWDAKMGPLNATAGLCQISEYRQGRHPLQPGGLGVVDIRIAILGAAVVTAYTVCKLKSTPKQT